jgi:hypothetical protein
MHGPESNTPLDEWLSPKQPTKAFTPIQATVLTMAFNNIQSTFSSK